MIRVVQLIDLDPAFYRVVEPGRWQRVEHIDEAQGLRFLCPKCYLANRGAIGTHSVICWSRSRGVADTETPGPGRWKIEGTAFHDLTLNADLPSGARSIDLTVRKPRTAEDGPWTPSCGWHGFVTNGEVTA